MVLSYKKKDGEHIKFEPPGTLEEWDSLSATIDPFTLALATFSPTDKGPHGPLLRISAWSSNKLRSAYLSVGRDVFSQLSREVARAYFGNRPPQNPLGLLVYRCNSVSAAQNLKEVEA